MSIKTTILKLSSNTSIGARLAKGATWSAIGTFLSQGFAFLSSIIIARIIGKNEFGQLGIINSTIGMVGVFAGIGLGLTTTKYIAEFKKNDPVRTGKIIGLSIIIALISSLFICIGLFFLAPTIATKALYASELSDEIKISCFIVLFNTLSGIQIGTLSGFEKFDDIAKINIARGILSLPLTIVGVVFFGLVGVVWANAILSFLIFMYGNQLFFRECKNNNITIEFKHVESELPIIRLYSIPALLSNIVVVPTLWIANTILVQQKDGYGGLGELNAANQLRMLLVFLPTILTNVALPMLSKAQGDSDKRNFEQISNLTQSITVLAIMPFFCVMTFIGDLLMQLYGRDFSRGQTVLVGIITGITVSSIGSIAGTGIQAKGRMWLGALQNLSWGVVYILISYILAPTLGATALAFGFAVAHIFLLIWGYIYLRRDLSIEIMKRTFTSLGFILIVAAASIVLPLKWRIGISIPVLGICVFLCIKFWASTYVVDTLRKMLTSIGTSAIKPLD